MTTVIPEAERDSPHGRIVALADGGSVVERGHCRGGMWANALVRGVPSVLFALDHRRQGGALDSENCALIVDAYRQAIRDARPIVGLWHSAGARLQDGVHSLHAVAQVFRAMTEASGHVPQISVVLGPAAGGAAYGPALTDVVIMAPDARVFITGPSIIHDVTGEDVDADTLGGPRAHAETSGVAHISARSTEDAFHKAASLVELIGAPNRCNAEVPDRDFQELIPDNSRRAYDIHPLIDRLLDGPPVELHADWARNIVTSLGRFGEGSVGVIASNPLRKGGCLDSQAAEKAARFVRMCDSFGLPLVVLVDVPGYLPGVREEWGGVVRRGAKLLHAFAEAVVPRATVILRKAYGGAYIAMNCRGLGASHVMAWPQAEVAVMGATAAVRLLRRRELAGTRDDERAALEARFVAEHTRQAGGIEAPVALGVVDEIVAPDRTRSALARALSALPRSRGVHGNIPL